MYQRYTLYVKGIVLAGGTGSRLWPTTLAVSKQLLPVYDKPLIFYPVSTLMLAGIREILVINRPEDQMLFKKLLGDGREWGVSITYAQQSEPKGIAEAFIIGEEFLNGDEVCLILGDNIFFGVGLGNQLSSVRNVNGALIFGYRVQNPEDYGVVDLGKYGEVQAIVEKPKTFVSPFAVPGIYFYDNTVCSVAKQIEPSERGELEITSINNFFLMQRKLKYQELSRGTFWADTGNFDSLLAAGNFVSIVQNRQGITMGSPMDIATQQGWIR